MEARTARELAARLLGRTQDPPDPAYLAHQVRQLTRRIAEMPGRTLEEELIEIFSLPPAIATPRSSSAITVGMTGGPAP